MTTETKIASVFHVLVSASEEEAIHLSIPAKNLQEVLDTAELYLSNVTTVDIGSIDQFTIDDEESSPEESTLGPQLSGTVFLTEAFQEFTFNIFAVPGEDLRDTVTKLLVHDGRLLDHSEFRVRIRHVEYTPWNLKTDIPITTKGLAKDYMSQGA